MRRIEGGGATQGSIERKGIQPIDIKRFVPQFIASMKLRDKRIFINALETRLGGVSFSDLEVRSCRAEIGDVTRDLLRQYQQ